MRFFGLLAVLISTVAFADSSIECKAIKVLDSSFFEESLSVEEYPEVAVKIDSFNSKATIGSSSYDASKGDEIKALPTLGFDSNFAITPQSEKDVTYRVNVSGRPAQGVLWATRKGQKPIQVAELSCK